MMPHLIYVQFQKSMSKDIFRLREIENSRKFKIDELAIGDAQKAAQYSIKTIFSPGPFS